MVWHMFIVKKLSSAAFLVDKVTIFCVHLTLHRTNSPHGHRQLATDHRSTRHILSQLATYIIVSNYFAQHLVKVCNYVFQLIYFVLIAVSIFNIFELKGIGKEFQQSVIRRYLEKSIQKKLFCHLQSLQIKTIFQEKSSICKIYCRGICDFYLWRS